MISLAKHFVYRPQLCLTVCDPMDCSLPGSSVHGILQARILEWVAVPFSRGSSQPRSLTLQILNCLSHQGSPIVPYVMIKINLIYFGKKNTIFLA